MIIPLTLYLHYEHLIQIFRELVSAVTFADDIYIPHLHYTHLTIATSEATASSIALTLFENIQKSLFSLLTLGKLDQLEKLHRVQKKSGP
jgi:hypothetical protein